MRSRLNGEAERPTDGPSDRDGLAGSRLSNLESSYYSDWMNLTGDFNSLGWSKRRAMFWGLLVATSPVEAYAAGERIARQIGRPASPPWSSPRGIPAWFFRKAVIAELFTIELTGQRYRLIERPADPWAVLLRALALAMANVATSAGLPERLPPRPMSDHTTVEVEQRAEALFGAAAMAALVDVIRDVGDPDASEFRFAVMRGNREDAYFWFQKEWSFRAKERFRGEVTERQDARCACCNQAATKLELNHKRKVRDFGPTQAANLEALCPPCHRSVDRQAVRCH